MNYQIMLMPNLASEGNMAFDGWYEDSALTTPLTSYEIINDNVLYGIYGIILIVAFDENGGENVSFSSKKVVFSSTYGDLPEAIKTGYTAEWYTERTGGNKIESGSKVTTDSNHTLYVHWTINQYTLSFETNGGSECPSITQDYNTLVTFP